MSHSKTASPRNSLLATSLYDGTDPSSFPSDATHAIEHLIEIVQRLSLAQNMQQITAIASAAARQLTGADGAAFILREEDQSFYVDEDSIGPLWKGQRFPISVSICGWVMNNCTSVIIPDVYQDSRIRIDDYRATFVQSMAMVPIRTHNPVGAIGIYWTKKHTPGPEQIRILQALADSTAVAIQNVRVREELLAANKAAKKELRTEVALRKRMEAKLLRLSLTDELTGLNNRHGFLLRAEQLVKLVNRVPTNGWLIYLALDGLERVNSQWGHYAGDWLVRSAAKVLRESFRDSDILSRIGGDAFAVLATGASTPAMEIEERLNRNIEHHNRCFPDQPTLSIDIGVIRCDSQSPHTLEDKICQADAAMYVEKRRKRDRLRNDISE
jgi:diguanylate cyclase (GGDEF)-like protein